MKLDKIHRDEINEFMKSHSLKRIKYYSNYRGGWHTTEYLCTKCKTECLFIFKVKNHVFVKNNKCKNYKIFKLINARFCYLDNSHGTTLTYDLYNHNPKKCNEIIMRRACE